MGKAEGTSLIPNACRSQAVSTLPLKWSIALNSTPKTSPHYYGCNTGIGEIASTPYIVAELEEKLGEQFKFPGWLKPTMENVAIYDVERLELVLALTRNKGRPYTAAQVGEMINGITDQMQALNEQYDLESSVGLTKDDFEGFPYDWAKTNRIMDFVQFKTGLDVKKNSIYASSPLSDLVRNSVGSLGIRFASKYDVPPYFFVSTAKFSPLSKTTDIRRLTKNIESFAMKYIIDAIVTSGRADKAVAETAYRHLQRWLVDVDIEYLNNLNRVKGAYSNTKTKLAFDFQMPELLSAATIPLSLAAMEQQKGGSIV